jgi:hypothetical protein
LYSLRPGSREMEGGGSWEGQNCQQLKEVQRLEEEEEEEEEGEVSNYSAVVCVCVYIYIYIYIYIWWLVKNTVVNLHFTVQDEENMSIFNSRQLAICEPAQCTVFH